MTTAASSPGWSVIDTRMAVSAAAREAVRVVVEAPGRQLSHEPGDDLSIGGTQLDQLELQAIARAEEAMVQHGKTVTPGELDVIFGPLEGDLRCAVVVVRVSYLAPSIGLPIVGIFSDGIGVTVEHRQRVDPFRAGLVGEVSCD